MLPGKPLVTVSLALESLDHLMGLEGSCARRRRTASNSRLHLNPIIAGQSQFHIEQLNDDLVPCGQDVLHAATTSHILHVRDEGARFPAGPYRPAELHEGD